MSTPRIILVLAVSLAFACGQKPGLQETDNNRSANGGPAEFGTMMEFELSPIDAVPIQAEATWSVPLRMRIQSSIGSRGAAGEAVSFTLKQAPDATSSLSALTAISDDSGQAAVDLRLGPLSGDAIITVSHSKAAPFDLYVNVGEATTGTFRVDISDPANSPVDLAPYRISFFEQSAMDCTTYHPRKAKPQVIAEMHVADTSQEIMQSGFAANTQFTVVGEALGAGGLTLAGGCVDGLSVNPGETKVADVRLALVPISPSGTYEVESTWDVSEAVASQNGATGALVRVIEFMADPGQAIYDIVLDEIEDAVGFGLDLLLDIAGVKDRLINYVNGRLNQSGTIATFSAISADLSTMLNELRVSSRLTIAKTDDDFNFSGHEEWTSVEVSWTWRCARSQTAGCESQVVDLTEAGSSAGAVSYDWMGRVENYSGLVVDSHAAQIDIGRLQLYLFEQVILPDITAGQANSIEDAIVYWIDCNALAANVLQGQEICDPTGFFCAGQDEAASACESGLGALASYIAEPLRNLDTSLDIELAGRGVLVDGDSSGIADQIDDGVTTGQLSGSTEPVTVEWSAVVATTN